jgi:hypothetical protein
MSGHIICIHGDASSNSFALIRAHLTGPYYTSLHRQLALLHRAEPRPRSTVLDLGYRIHHLLPARKLGSKGAPRGVPHNLNLRTQAVQVSHTLAGPLCFCESRCRPSAGMLEPEDSGREDPP